MCGVLGTIAGHTLADGAQVVSASPSLSSCLFCLCVSGSGSLLSLSSCFPGGELVSGSEWNQQGFAEVGGGQVTEKEG